MNSSLDEDKKQIRKLVKQHKSAYSFAELAQKSATILTNLNSIEEIQQAKTILSYWSLNDEVHTFEWNIEQYRKGKTILLPSVEGNDLIIRRFEGEESLVEQPPFGIKEPTGKIFDDLQQIEIVIVPGIAFDIQFNRLGRGKGYYDRFLKKIKCLKIGTCFDFQLFDRIPHDEHDIKMDMIVCESKIIRS